MPAYPTSCCFSCSHLFAPSLQSECLEQAKATTGENQSFCTNGASVNLNHQLQSILHNKQCCRKVVLRDLIRVIRAVIKRWGPGIPQATMNVAPGYFQRKIEQNYKNQKKSLAV